MPVSLSNPLEQNMFGSYLQSALGGMSTGQEPIIVPVPVQAPAKKAPAKKVNAPSKVNQTASRNSVSWLVAPVTDFGTSPTYAQDAVPSMPVQPAWQQDLSQFLNGTTLPQAMTPPTYQGFGMPVFSDAQAFAMSPQEYTSVLDTTKNNIAFNNKVAGDNYNNTLNIIRTLQQADQASQEQYSRNLQNRNAVISGNKGQQDIANTQSPQEHAAMSLKLSDSLSTLSDNRHEVIANRAAKRDHIYAIELQDRQNARADNRASKQGQQALSDLLIKRDIDIWADALKGFTPEELNTVKSAESSSMLEQLMANNPNIKPLSKYNLRAAFEAQQRIKARGGNVGDIFTQPNSKQEEGAVTITSKDQLKKYLSK